MNIIRSAMAHLVIALIISVIYALCWSLSSIRLLPEPSPISNALVPIAIALFLGLSSVGVDRFNQKDWHGRFDGVTGALTDIFGKYTNEFIDQDSKMEAYNEILEKRGAQGALCGMSPEFVATVFESVHEESVRQQIEIINK